MNMDCKLNDDYFSTRRALRVKNYDYSKSGFYFLTLCVQHGLHLFGKFVEKDLELNNLGKRLLSFVPFQSFLQRRGNL